ncbi:MAG: glycosyltransferase family 4 protein [Candidatus Aminicenantes bacterium]|nr:glycosyltransferase family 4 protein [Candidatus Aminicenantes bacterium]
MSKIRILEIIDRPFLGGGQKNLLSIAEALDRSKYEIEVCSQDNGPLVEELKQKNIRHLPVSIRKITSLKAVKKLRNLMKEQGYDIVHTHGGIAGLYGRWAAFRSGIPVVIHTLHGIHYLYYRNFLLRWGYVFLERLFSRFTQTVIFVSHADMEKGRRHRLAPFEKMKVVKNGIDFDKVRVAAVIPEKFNLKEQLGLENDFFFLGTVARIHRQKNIPGLIKAAVVLQDALPEARFIIVGDGPMMAKVKNMIERFGLQEIVFLLGERPDAHRIMSQFDVFILPSLWEGLPYVLMEAGALGLPVVASNIAGVREIIQDGETGFLVPKDNPQELVEAIIQLKSDPKLRSELGKRLQEKIQSEYSITRMIREIEEIYSKSQ